jgi:IS5 family transposase
MIKILVLQHWYSLSDQRIERELANNVSFMNFLGFPEIIPDSTNIWLFRERLTEKGKPDGIWQELQRQLDAKGLVVKEGSIQDATFIAWTREDRATSLEVTKPELAGAKMERGLRKEMSFILDISFITRWM